MVATRNEIAITKVPNRISPRGTHTLDQLGIYHNENSHAHKHKPRRLYGTIGHAYTVCNQEYEHYHRK